jgi:hypothetical protein
MNSTDLGLFAKEILKVSYIRSSREVEKLEPDQKFSDFISSLKD